jgi:hypothetical protein
LADLASFYFAFWVFLSQVFVSKKRKRVKTPLFGHKKNKIVRENSYTKDKGAERP